jgi:hypothetical protein
MSAKGKIMGEVESALLKRGIGHQWMPPLGQDFSRLRDIGAQGENLFYYLANAPPQAVHTEL